MQSRTLHYFRRRAMQGNAVKRLQIISSWRCPLGFDQTQTCGHIEIWFNMSRLTVVYCCLTGLTVHSRALYSSRRSSMFFYSSYCVVSSIFTECHRNILLNTFSLYRTCPFRTQVIISLYNFFLLLLRITLPSPLIFLALASFPTNSLSIFTYFSPTSIQDWIISNICHFFQIAI